MQRAFVALKILLLLGLGLTLASCAPTTVTSGVTSACGVWPYVSWSDKDTDETIADAKLNNARRDGFCK